MHAEVGFRKSEVGTEGKESVEGMGRMSLPTSNLE